MPFVHVFDESDDPNQYESMPKEFDYEDASAIFEPEKLSSTAQLVLEALRALGATHFRVLYDGGCDEGFAHAERLIFDPDHIPLGSKVVDMRLVVDHLLNSPLVQKIREIGKTQKYVDIQNSKITDERLVQRGLDELAHEIASLLLGMSYGTGEYALYGAFTADIYTGEIVDDPDAPKTGSF